MLREIIPIIDVIKANKKLKVKIKEENILVPEQIEKVNIKYLEEDYAKSIEAKNRFEDKAKTIIAALTIAITIILNISDMIEAITVKFDIWAISVGVFILSVMSIIYMLLAGIMSIQVIIKENILFSIPVIEKVKKNKKNIYIKTQLNINQNLIRNNIIFSAYRSIRNSVVCLVILFILAVLPMPNGDQFEVQEKIKYEENITFSQDALDRLSENKTESIDYDKILQVYNQRVGDTTKRNIYDKEHQIIISIQKVEDIYIIDSIISDIEEIE